MKKMNIVFISLFALFAQQQLQAIDLTKVIVSILSLGSSQNQNSLIMSQYSVHKDLQIAAQKQLHNMKPYNTGFHNLYNVQIKQDDTQSENHYYLRGSYDQRHSTECDDCGGDC